MGEDNPLQPTGRGCLVHVNDGRGASVTDIFALDRHDLVVRQEPFGLQSLGLRARRCRAIFARPDLDLRTLEKAKCGLRALQVFDQPVSCALHRQVSVQLKLKSANFELLHLGTLSSFLFCSTPLLPLLPWSKPHARGRVMLQGHRAGRQQSRPGMFPACTPPTPQQIAPIRQQITRQRSIFSTGWGGDGDMWMALHRMCFDPAG
jgi:hypothetical protein